MILKSNFTDTQQFSVIINIIFWVSDVVFWDTSSSFLHKFLTIWQWPWGLYCKSQIPTNTYASAIIGLFVVTLKGFLTRSANTYKDEGIFLEVLFKHLLNLFPTLPSLSSGFWVLNLSIRSFHTDMYFPTASSMLLFKIIESI